jgi:hypothetical protein
MRTFWKAYQVYFPMVPVTSTLEFPILRYVHISEDYSKGQQVFPRQNVGATSHAKLYHYTMYCDACCNEWKDY